MFFKQCKSDDELARVSLFLFENKHELHANFATLDMLPLLYSYVTEGTIIQVTDDDNQIIGASVFYIGTPENEYTDKDTALIDIVVFKREHRGTRLFLNGLNYLIHHIMKEHSEVKDVRMIALAANKRVCKLYSKFMITNGTREGDLGNEIIFSEKIMNISTFLKKFFKV